MAAQQAAGKLAEKAQQNASSLYEKNYHG